VNKIKYFSAITVICLLVSACKTSKTASSGGNNSKVETFDTFYDRFHRDEAFQKSRTKFPLQGKSISEGKEVKWTPESLPMMKVKIYDVDKKTYKSTYKKTDKSFIQKVWQPNTEFLFEARFELISKKWFLVYVLDQNF
jgi:hypothetical protein